MFDDLAHLVGKKVQGWQALVGVCVFVAFIPTGFSSLLVEIGPVENLVVVKLLVGNRFEGRSGKVERKPAFDVIESPISFERVDAFVGFIDYQQVPV